MDEARQAVLALVGQWTLEGTLPADRATLEQRLLQAGHSAEAVHAVLGPPPEPARRRPRLPVAQLSDDATRFLHVLRDLGYLDEAMEDEVLDGVMAECGGNVGLDELRRHVAAVLFDRQFELEPETLRLLEEEWRVVFH